MFMKSQLRIYEDYGMIDGVISHDSYVSTAELVDEVHALLTKIQTSLGVSDLFAYIRHGTGLNFTKLENLRNANALTSCLQLCQ